jgi:hypothetical protein
MFHSRERDVHFHVSSVAQRMVAALIVGATLVGSPPASARDTTLPKATDLAADARMAQQSGIPVLVLVSLAGCPHCESIRRGHLTPMLTEKPPRAVIRQVDLQSNAPMRGFDGKPTTHAAFLQQQEIKFAPVVLLFTPDGKRAVEPLVGAMLPDFYGAYLDDAVRAATAKVRPTPR